MNVVLSGNSEYWCKDLTEFDNRFPPSMFKVARVECNLNEFDKLLRSSEDFNKESINYGEDTMTGSYIVRRGVCFQTHESYV